MVGFCGENASGSAIAVIVVGESKSVSCTGSECDGAVGGCSGSGEAASLAERLDT